METDEERAAVLPEAFRPPDAEGEESGGGTAGPQQDMLWTTPMGLLHAIDLELGRMARGGGGGEALSLPGEVALDGAERVKTLESLRTQVDAWCDVVSLN